VRFCLPRNHFKTNQLVSPRCG